MRQVICVCMCEYFFFSIVLSNCARKLVDKKSAVGQKFQLICKLVCFQAIVQTPQSLELLLKSHLQENTTEQLVERWR